MTYDDGKTSWHYIFVFIGIGLFHFFHRRRHGYARGHQRFMRVPR